MCVGAGSRNERPRLLETTAGAPLQRDARKAKASQRSRPCQRLSLLRRLASHQEEMGRHDSGC